MRPSEPTSSADAFAPTDLGGGGERGGEGAAARARRQQQRLRADQLALCGSALALRPVLALLALALVAALPVSDGPADWWRRAMPAAFVTLSAALMWLGLVCAARQALARCRLGVAAAWAVLLGGLAGLGGWMLALPLGAVPPGGWSAGSAAACGAVAAAAVWAWLLQRALAAQPAVDAARLAELQSRIRPHFLFNALNTALALVQVDPPRAEAVLEDLSTLFRAALAETGSAVTLAEEVDLAARYLAIEQVRFGPRLVVHWDIDPKVAGALLPPLVLQPLVENAVRHGIEPSAAGGELRITGRATGGMAVLEVTNPLPAQPGPPGSGLALANVRERLHLLHDLAGRLATETVDGRWVARLEVPL